MKKLPLIIVIFSILFAVGCTQGNEPEIIEETIELNVMASEHVCDDLADLIFDSEVVIIGKVNKNKNSRSGYKQKNMKDVPGRVEDLDDSDIFNIGSDYEIEVEQVFKGLGSEKTIQILIPGGVVGRTLIKEKNSHMMEAEERYVFFLEDVREAYKSGCYGMSSIEGRFRIEDGMVRDINKYSTPAGKELLMYKDLDAVIDRINEILGK